MAGRNTKSSRSVRKQEKIQKSEAMAKSDTSTKSDKTDPKGKKDEECKSKVRSELLKIMNEKDRAPQGDPLKFRSEMSSVSADGGDKDTEEVPLSLPTTIITGQDDLKPLEQVNQRRVKDYFDTGYSFENRFSITLKIKDGGFGQVYKVIDKVTRKEIALKIEKNTSAVAAAENEEGVVLRAFQGHPHCPQLYAMGQTVQFCYTAMQLLAENMSEARRACLLKPTRLSTSAACRTTLQCIDAIEGLHNVGYVHRDVKPSNFAIGFEPKLRGIVYMLDFGLCRYIYMPDRKTLRQPRENVGFRGTVRYASLTAHEKQELSRVDDLWSLFYTFVEFLTGQLPWRTTNDKIEVGKLKRKYSHTVLCQIFPAEIGQFCKAMENVKFYDTPNYELMRKCLLSYLPKISAKMDDQYDWEMTDCTTLIHWNPPQ